VSELALDAIAIGQGGREEVRKHYPRRVRPRAPR
jgi:hypothetical protein